jgi:hypothetical protein
MTGFETNLPGRLKKRASLRRRQVPKFLLAAFAIECQVEPSLLLIVQQIVEPISLWFRVRQSSAATHDSMKTVRMFFCKCDEYANDRVPRIGPLRCDEVTTDLALEAILQAGGNDRVSVGDGGVKNRDELSERCSHQPRVNRGKFVSGESGARFGQHVQPHTKASRVERFVHARSNAAPQVEVEDG